MCALETKHLNGTVYVRGDTWEIDKYDNYGNRVESGRPIEDRRGRSPSEQLNGSVRPLDRFLARRGLLKRIGRAARDCHLSPDGLTGQVLVLFTLTPALSLR